MVAQMEMPAPFMDAGGGDGCVLCPWLNDGVAIFQVLGLSIRTEMRNTGPFVNSKMQGIHLIILINPLQSEEIPL